MSWTLSPRGALSLVVDAIWYAAPGSCGAGAESALPTGDVDLVFHLGADRSAVAIGPSNRARALEPRREAVVGATLKVGTGAMLLGVPLHDVRDGVFDLADFWGAEAEAVHDQAASAPTPIAALDAMHEAMAARLARSARWPHPVAAPAAMLLRDSSGGRATVTALAQSFGMSTRRFEQIFRADVGLAPKTYQRLHRFRRALVDVDRAADVGWSRFAAEHGYCDQSQLIGEFRSHCGMTPVGYVRARGPTLNHLPIPD